MRHSLTAVSLLLLTTNAFAQEGYTAKSLFFAEDDSVVAASTGTAVQPVVAQSKNQSGIKKVRTQVAAKKPATKPMGASYFIRLKNNDGSTRDVLATRKFKSGEHFQLGVKVNRPTYVYILNEAPDGKVAQIYPPRGQNNFIDAMGTVFLPSQGTFEFDNQPGTEKLLVYLSSSSIGSNITEKIKSSNPDIVPVSSSATDIARCASTGSLQATTTQEPDKLAMAGSDTGYATKGITFKDDPVSACANTSVYADGYAAKGIVFSDDPAPVQGGQVASYVVKTSSPAANKSLYLKLNLIHE